MPNLREEVTEDSYERKHFKQFVEDMLGRGLEPYHYNGRFYYKGPAVNVSNIQDALSFTKVKCQWDNMGLDFVVYPTMSAEYLDDKDDKEECDGCGYNNVPLDENDDGDLLCVECWPEDE